MKKRRIKRTQPRPPSLVRSIARLSLRSGDALVLHIPSSSGRVFDVARRFVDQLRQAGAIPEPVKVIILPPGFEFGTMVLPPLVRTVTA